MKVLCNLAPLGRGIIDPQARTGVYRVAEQLIHGLVASPECECFFHAGASLRPSWRYFEERLRGPRTHFTVSPWRVAAARPLESAERFVCRSSGNRSLPFRALRFAASRAVTGGDWLLDRPDNRTMQAMDIYHSPFMGAPAAVRARRSLRRFTTVYDLIALTHPQFFGPTVTALARTMTGRYDEEDYAVCISQATRDALLTHAPRLDPTRVFVAPLAAGPIFHPESDPARLAAARARIGLPPDVPYFLSLCTLEPRKNLDKVIRAFVRLKQEAQIDRETRLVLVGKTGWKTETIFSALEEARVGRDAILLTGFLPDEELAPIYSGALAFVYMSWLEGFGLPPLEAMQCGVPTITSNTSSLPEVVGDAGIMLAPDDLDGLTGAMGALANDEARRRDLSARALARAAGFSWERFVGQNLAAYRAALARD